MMHRIFVIVFAILFCGCTAAMYQPNIHTYNLSTGQEIKPDLKSKIKALPVPTLTTFEQWPSMWTAVCGAVITDSVGKITGMLPGSCGTPLTIIMSSSLNEGLAVTAASAIH